MKDQLVQRLTVLKAEFDAGQRMLAELESKQAELRNTLIRISGAVQVLEEELAKSASAASPAVTLEDSDTNEPARLNSGAS
jgi:predicted nuclease with TOPRIM domain